MRNRASGLVLGLGLAAIVATLAESSWRHVAFAQSPERNGQASGARPCTLRSLRGTYGVLATGTVVTPPPGSAIPAGPFATVGTLAIDRDGNAVLNATRSFNGEIVKEADLPGTLTLNDDCTGFAEFQGGRMFDLVILGDGAEMHWIQTNPGAVVTVIVKRQ
jgi:hypothetical protein